MMRAVRILFTDPESMDRFLHTQLTNMYIMFTQSSWWMPGRECAQVDIPSHQIGPLLKTLMDLQDEWRFDIIVKPS
jgi:hypothetical protein